MTYEENYLAHYGIKGQRWGIRRYQNEDGSLTQLGKEHYSVESGGNEKFDKEYRKEAKKYKKLADKADLNLQKEKLEGSKRIAKAGLKVGVAAGLATAGLAGLNNKINDDYSKKSFDLFIKSVTDDETTKRINNLAAQVEAVRELNKQNGKSLPVSAERAAEKIISLKHDPAWYTQRQMELLDKRHNTVSGITTLATIASATAATVGLGAAAYGGVSAAVAKQRLSDKGHAKAVAKRDAQYKKITNMVKDTPYAALFADQIAAYKKEHPNTELSDKQIMKNLM